MKFFKRPIVAVLITLVLVVGSTLLSAGLKLQRSSEQIVNGFYDGVRYQGEKHAAVAASLRALCGDAEQLAIIGGNYGLETAPLTADTEALRSALSYENTEIGAIYDVFESFYNKLLVLTNELQHRDLSERHQQQLEQLTADVAAQKAAIDSAGYNESVSAFLRKNNRYPAKRFAALFNIPYPVYFA